MISVEWEDADAEREAAIAAAGAGVVPPPPAEDDDEGDGQAPPRPPEGSVLAQLQEEADEIAEDDGIKILRVGKHASLHARYRMLDDDEVLELQLQAKRQYNITKRITRRRKGDQDLKISGGENPEAERYFDALILATACEEILYESEGGKLTPLHELDEIDAKVAVKYNRTLATILRLDKDVDGRGPLIADIGTAGPTDVVIAMHTWTRQRSTSPLTATAQILKIWMGAIDVAAMQEALGGN